MIFWSHVGSLFSKNVLTLSALAFIQGSGSSLIIALVVGKMAILYFCCLEIFNF